MSAQPSETPQEATLERIRKQRLIVVWLGAAVFISGNTADWLGWINWGPQQQNPDQRYWVLASACGFWIAASTLLILIADSWLAFRQRSAPPTYHDLKGGGPLRSRANWVREKAETYHALFGAGGLVLGALVGHLIWRP